MSTVFRRAGRTAVDNSRIDYQATNRGPTGGRYGGYVPATRRGPAGSGRIPDSFGQGSAFGLIGDLLDQYGLGTLLDTATRWLQQGFSPEEIAVKLRGTDAFKARFPAIELREKAGLPAISPAEYVQYERATRQLLQSANLPRGFYDDNESITKLLANDISPAELDTRIKQGYQRVRQLDGGIRDAFSQYFGVETDDALAAYFLDPDVATSVLEQRATEAEIGGAGRRYGMNITEALARRLYGVEATGQSVTQALTELNQDKAMFSETVSENEDLTMEDTGLSSKFGMDPDSAEKMRRRQLAREATFAQGGGASSSQEGFGGAGAARKGSTR